MVISGLVTDIYLKNREESGVIEPFASLHPPLVFGSLKSPLLYNLRLSRFAARKLSLFGEESGGRA